MTQQTIPGGEQMASANAMFVRTTVGKVELTLTRNQILLVLSPGDWADLLQLAKDHGTSKALGDRMHHAMKHALDNRL